MQTVVRTHRVGFFYRHVKGKRKLCRKLCAPPVTVETIDLVVFSREVTLVCKVGSTQSGVINAFTKNRKSYTENFYSYNSKYINNALALRPPQHESLEFFARLCDTLSLAKNPTTTEQIRSEHQAELETLTTEDKRTKKISEWASEAAAEFYADDLAAARALCPTLTSFERDFPSFCPGNRYRKDPSHGSLHCISPIREGHKELFRDGS